MNKPKLTRPIRKNKANTSSKVVDTDSIKKTTRRHVRKVRKNTGVYVRGEDQAQVDDGPKKVTAKSLGYQRRKVLNEGKKFIYPLRHGKYRIALVSVALSVVLLVASLLFGYVALYRRQATGDTIYRLTEIFPVPAGSVNGESVRYEEYLFELRLVTYSIEQTDKIDFTTPEGQDQLRAFEVQARNKVAKNELTRQLAEEYGVSVSQEEIDEQIDIIRRQVGAVVDEDKAADRLETTLQKRFDWTLEDFEREMELQLLQLKIVPFIDTETVKRADQALGELESGEDFGAVAKKYSDDTGTTPTGGEFSQPVKIGDKVVSKKVLETGFALQEDEYSKEKINTLFETRDGRNVLALHIVKNNKTVDSETRRLAQILFLYDDFESLIADDLLEAQENANWYID